MEQYLVFCWGEGFMRGGMKDCISSSNTMKGATEIIDRWLKRNRYIPLKLHYQVYDQTSKTFVLEGARQ